MFTRDGTIIWALRYARYDFKMYVDVDNDEAVSIVH